jgi:hypothetical protein
VALLGIGPRIEVPLRPHVRVDPNAQLFRILADVYRDVQLVGDGLGFVDGSVHPSRPVARAVDQHQLRVVPADPYHYRF